jgi:hypothetical protein
VATSLQSNTPFQPQILIMPRNLDLSRQIEARRGTLYRYDESRGLDPIEPAVLTERKATGWARRMI